MVGIKKMLEIQARHARTNKCTHSFVPVLNGLKVRISVFSLTFSSEHMIFFVWVIQYESFWFTVQGLNPTILLQCPCGVHEKVNLTGSESDGKDFDECFTKNVMMHGLNVDKMQKLLDALNMNGINMSKTKVGIDLRQKRMTKIRNDAQMEIISMKSDIGEFYFRWLENSVIEIGKATKIPLIFNHLNWNSFKHPAKIQNS